MICSIICLSAVKRKGTIHVSIEAAKLLIEKMKTDKVFAKKFAEIKNEETLMIFMKKSGFDCTPAEIKEASDELNDNDLDMISGGITAIELLYMLLR